MRRDSWRSVPRMCRPPSDRTSSPSALQRAAYFSTSSAKASGSSSESRPCSRNSSLAIISGLPPSRMSVPRPAMLVLTVMAPLRPAWATTYASRSWCLALRTACGIFFFLRRLRDRVALLDAGRADEDRLALLVVLEQLRHDGRELLALGLVDDVLVILADHRLVRRDRDRRRACRCRGTRWPRCRPCRSCRRASCRGGRGSGR